MTTKSDEEPKISFIFFHKSQLLLLYGQLFRFLGFSPELDILFRQRAKRDFFVPVDGELQHFVYALEICECKLTVLIGRGFVDQYRVRQGVDSFYLGAHGYDQPAFFFSLETKRPSGTFPPAFYANCFV